VKPARVWCAAALGLFIASLACDPGETVTTKVQRPRKQGWRCEYEAKRCSCVEEKQTVSEYCGDPYRCCYESTEMHWNYHTSAPPRRCWCYSEASDCAKADQFEDTKRVRRCPR